ncbi:MarR family winged helix-turn-helix transcriptional regulator [Spirochaetota bacterium]
MSNIDNTIVAILDKFNQVQRSLMWEIAKTENLSPIQIQLLTYINHNSSDLNKVSILAKDFDLTKATVSDAVNSLERKKLIKKVKDRDDKRSFSIELTSKGKKVFERASQWSEVIFEQLKGFSFEEKKNAMVFLMDLLKSLFDEGAICIARMCIACSNFQRDIKPDSEKPHKCDLMNKYVSDEELHFCFSFNRGSCNQKKCGFAEVDVRSK